MSKTKSILIPPLEQSETVLLLIGDRPLMVNNKLNVAQEISDQYSGKGKAGHVKKSPVSEGESYARAFYTLPDSKYPAPHPKGRYGVPASGIKKCACKAIRNGPTRSVLHAETRQKDGAILPSSADLAPDGEPYPHRKRHGQSRPASP
jgi:hypothetical protein